MGNIDELITDKSVLYLKDNKKEINAWFQPLGIDVPRQGTQLGVIRSIDFGNILSQDEGGVKSSEKKSVGDIDEIMSGEEYDVTGIIPATNEESMHLGITDKKNLLKRINSGFIKLI